MLFGKLDQITSRKKMSGKRGYFLGKEECTTTITSLALKGLIKRSPDLTRLSATGLIPRES